ncbi:MAG: ABC transporter substrate-binding protein, partial [Actinobacteria bacterium]
MRRALAFAVLVGVGATVWAGFGTAGDKTVRSASGTTSVTISNEQGTTWTCGFSPFNGDVNSLSFGPVYEELVFVNGLKSGATTNWLASSYKWGNGNKTLTFTIRSGV